MDKYTDDILKFEQALNKRNIYKQKVIYDDTTGTVSSNDYKIEDVISSVSKQIKAIQKADCVKNITRQLEKSDLTGRSEFLPLHVLSNKVLKQDVQNKFETQCVSDTQLIHIVENAESVAASSGITQEFETTFNQKADTNINNNTELVTGQGINKSKEKNCDLNREDEQQFLETSKNISAHLGIIKKSEKIVSNNFKENVCDFFANSDVEDVIFEPLEDNVVKSPILNKIKSIVIKNTPSSSLIYKLDSFEKFEAIALPIIEKHSDLKIAKKIINSQIGNKELCMSSHTNPVLQNREGSISPVFEVRVSRKSSDTKICIGKDNSQKVKHINSPTITEDEILFSSDEEDYISGKYIDDLPLTCALETSFYNETGILDKTMYVGFQTASNKSIQIHTDSFLKAKNVLDDNSMDLKDLVNIFNTSICNENSNMVETTEKKYSKESKTLEEDTISQKPMKTDVFNDLDNNKVASDLRPELKKKKIHTGDSISPKRVKYAKDDSQLHLKAVSDKSALKVNLEGGCVDESTKIYDDILQEFENSLIQEEKQDKSKDISSEIILKNIFKQDFQGFKTASLKPIKISTEALLRTKNLFEDIASDVESNLENEISKLKTVYKKNCIENAHCFKGFATASNKTIKISDKALIQSKIIFQDINMDSNIDEAIIKHQRDNSPIITKCDIGNTKFEGFRTANNNPINVSSKTLTKYKNIFHDIIDDKQDAVNSNSDTKQNNNEPKINNSEVKTIPQNKDSKNITFCFQTASQKPVEISEESLACSQKLLSNGLNKKSCGNTLKGFQTASNKQINISEETLARCKRIFADIKLDAEEEIYESKNRNEKVVKQILPQLNNEDTSKQSFKGFQTASNKKITISTKALAKYKTIFDGIDTELGNDFNEKSNERIKQNNEQMHPKLKFSFQTANNKEVDISEDALLSSQALLKFEPIEKEPISDFKGFQTASNRAVKVSKEYLARTKNIFDDIDFEMKNDLEQPKIKYHEELSLSAKFQFQTASQKLVDISEGAILGSQRLLKGKEKQSSLNSEFQGFQTASNKRLKISKEAFARTVNIFDGIDLQSESVDDISKNNLGADKDTIEPAICGFRIPNKLNKEIDDYKCTSYMQHGKNTSNNCIHKVDKTIGTDIKDMLNTQVIDNFEDTLYTEDFLKERTPVRCKRSGSPILSCPKAKMRKFQAPASVEKNKTSAKIDTCQRKSENIFVFDTNYKKQKKFTLKDLDKNKNDDNNSSIDDYVYNFKYENILEFKFKEGRNEVTNDIWSTDNIKEYFLKSVNNKIIPLGWIENHIKLIIWKLISYEIRFPHLQTVCTVRNILEQLKYRYDRELYYVQRPAFRKILERDDVSSKTMVVCVVGVYVDGVYVSSVANLTDTIELLLTDGWYCIKASIDRLISKHVYDGKISVGTKLLTHGAEMVNCEQGIAPWEDTSSVRLRIFGNSTRRARWDARLGYHGNPAILSRLSSVKPDGGKVSKMRVFVTRVYPTLYIEKFHDGSTVTRSERLENLHQTKYEADRQIILEKIYEDIEKEFSDQDTQDSEGLDIDSKLLESGSQIAKLMKRHRDPNEFRASLTESQLYLLEEYTARQKDRQIEQVHQKVRERIKNSSLSVARCVVPLLKIRVASVEGKECKISKGMLSIWRPNEAIQEVIAENTWIDVYNVIPTAIRNSEIQLSASRHAIFERSKIARPETINSFTDSLKRKCYQIKDIARNPLFNTDYNEIDTVGFVISIEPSNFETSKQLYQNIYLADENKNILCINFWGGIKKFGFLNIFDTGQVIVCVNLQKRSGNTVRNIPQYRATEFSYFTKTPKYECLRKLSDELIKVFSGLDKRKFCLDCVAIKNNFSTPKHRFPDISPYRLNNSDYNVSKNKNFIDSPVARDANLNLSGLDFESTFKQADTQDLSPNKLLRKKKVNEKIAKLKFYGEPPPLKPMNLIHKSKNITNAFKSPLTSRNERSNVASDKISTPKETIDKENSNLECSPVLSMNNVKRIINVNPVKLNFNNDREQTFDPFAEEFDPSPPLSLD